MKRRLVINILIVVFACIFLVSAFYLVSYLLESKKTNDQNDYLSNLRGTTPSRPPITTVPEITDPSTPNQSSIPGTTSGVPDPSAPSQPTVPVTPPATTVPQVTKPASPEEAGLVEVTDQDTGASVWMLPEFVGLYQINNDIVGWIDIPGSKVNYPVVQNQQDTDFYLYRDFWGNKKNSGTIYLRNDCDVFAPSDNLTIYGHMMKDNTMFGTLSNYMLRSTFQKQPYIYFDTLTERHTYKIFAVFMTSGIPGEGFPYHIFINARNEEEFDNFVATCKDLAYYDTGVTPKYGDKLITLSTCDPYPYSSGFKDGRLVVVAVRVA